MPVDLQFCNPSYTLEDQWIEVARTENSFIQKPPTTIDHEPTWKLRKFDPRLMRDQFQRAKTDKQIAAFLASCGPFLIPTLPQEIPRQEFLNCQNYIQAHREGTMPSAYPSIPPDQGERVCEKPEMDLPQTGSKFAIIRARTALELIGATLVLDRINAVSVGKCEQCGHLYDKKNNHERKYCDHPRCGRVAQNKARRKRVRDKKKRAARQPRSDNKPPATS